MTTIIKTTTKTFNTELFEQQIREAIEKSSSLYLQKKGQSYETEIYADYDDVMDDKTATEILKAKYPMETFYENVFNWYQDCEIQDKVDIRLAITKTLEKLYYPEGLPVEQDEFLLYWIDDNVAINYPESHFLDQEFNCTIMIDTGDGNYDYTLNTHYPHYNGRLGETMDNKASLVWLAKQQGYTKTQLRNALNEGDMANPKGFLQSCRVELANMTCHMMVLTILAKLSLRELIEINKLIKVRDKNGYEYDATKRINTGYITIDKKVSKNYAIGLFDPWLGGGSVLEIQLEKDLHIPVKFLRSVLPDGGDGYSVDAVYGLSGECWGKVVKDVKPIAKFKKDLEEIY